MRRLLILAATLAFGGFLPAHGACLLADYSVPAELKRSESVLVGTVFSERGIFERGYMIRTVYKVEPRRAFKGHIFGVLRVYSENDSGRFPMDVGKSYLLFLYREEGRLHADPCGNSSEKAKAAPAVTAVERLVARRRAS